MGLKKSGVKKGNSRLEDSGLFGIVDKVIPANNKENTIVDFSVPLNREARRSALASELEAERRKARAITLMRQMSIR